MFIPLEIPPTRVPGGEMLRYLGYRQQALSPALAQQVQQAAKALAGAARPRAVCRRLPLSRQGGQLLLGGSLPLPGEGIRRHLEGCSQCLLLGVTLGGEADRLVAAAQAVQMSQAVLLDAAGTAAIEALCDDLEEGLRRQFAAQGLCVGGRFSCGYGDLPVQIQPALLSLLDAQRQIGLFCTAACAMVPAKSVTALLGLAPHPPRPAARGCASCPARAHCPYQKEEI